jgi:hypothetical protein
MVGFLLGLVNCGPMLMARFPSLITMNLTPSRLYGSLTLLRNLDMRSPRI